MNSQQLLGFDSHISERYNKNLLGIFNNLLVLGGMVEEQMSGIYASITHNRISTDTDTVGESERKINNLDVSINEAVIHVIATNQPIASDLRLLLASVKITADLERIGDEIQKTHTLMAKNEEAMMQENSFSFEDLSNLLNDLIAMLNRALNAFARMDVDEALKVTKSDRKVDKEYNNLNRVLLTYIMENPSRVALYVDVANMLRSLERIGDHIANIAEHLIFIITGRDVRYLPPKEIGKIIKNNALYQKNLNTK